MRRSGKTKREQIAELKDPRLLVSWKNQRWTQPEDGMWGHLKILRTTREPIQRNETTTRFSRILPAQISHLDRGSPRKIAQFVQIFGRRQASIVAAGFYRGPVTVSDLTVLLSGQDVA